MAEKKKPIKQCRVKTDTCFKWHCMGKLFGLNLEDIGLAYLISQIKDDENNIRYGLIEEEILDMFKETEAEWLALHNAKMRTDPTYRIAFADLNGQRTATTNHYKAEVARREAYNNRIKNGNKENGEDTEQTENGELNESVTTSDEIKETVTQTPEEIEDLFIQYDLNKEAEEDMFTESVSLLFIRENADNLPSEEEWEELKNNYSNENLKRFVELGNKDKWQKHFTVYQDKMENEEEYPI